MRTDEDIARLVGRLGPLTGAELQAETGTDPFGHWKAATLSPRLAIRTVATRYLRLDREVDGYARLSPSILREFLTYTVVGLADDRDALERKAVEVAGRIRAVSRAKLDLAAGVTAAVTEGLAGDTARPPFCIFIAGDVVYEMAHNVPRPERSTGKMVRGSDLDLVVIVADEAPETLVQELDEAIYRHKYRYLINPSAREEIDYVVKRFGRLREQAAFDSFKKMVACKILQEGLLLHGSRPLFAAAKALLHECGVNRKLAALEADAVRHRSDAELTLLGSDRGILIEDARRLFYTSEESEEFE